MPRRKRMAAWRLAFGEALTPGTNHAPGPAAFFREPPRRRRFLKIALVCQTAFSGAAGLAVFLLAAGTTAAIAMVILMCTAGIALGVSLAVLPRLFRGTEALDSSARRKRIQDLVAGRMIVPAFQPIVDLSSGKLVGAEALSRFVTDDGAGPEYWFQEAAALGMSADLELAAIKASLAAAEELPDVYLALNVSPAACLEAGLVPLLMHSGIPLERIVLELTERDPVEDYTALNEALTPLRKRGVRVAIDDIGAGFSSMRHILKLQPDIIKLDRSLIRGIHQNLGQRALGTAMVAFAEEIGATTVAEGIESASELHLVALLGMNSAQGYFIGKPSILSSDWTIWPQHPTPGTKLKVDGQFIATWQ